VPTTFFVRDWRMTARLEHLWRNLATFFDTLRSEL